MAGTYTAHHTPMVHRKQAGKSRRSLDGEPPNRAADSCREIRPGRRVHDIRILTGVRIQRILGVLLLAFPVVSGDEALALRQHGRSIGFKRRKK